MNEELGQPIAAGRTALIYAWGAGRVLKLFRPEFTRGAEYEFAIAQAIDRCALPAPRVFELIEVAGRPGLVYERVEGPTMLNALMAYPERAEEYAQQLAELHASMHRVRPRGLPSLRPRLIEKISSARLADDDRATVSQALATLPEGDALCHGDFHPDNVVLTPGGPVIIDWNDASSGHPGADVGRTSLLLRLSEPPASAALAAQVAALRAHFFAVYMRRYAELAPLTAAEVARWRVPVAAARLGEAIEAERPALLREIRGQARDGVQ